jgi:hypothetical protein
VQNPAISPDSWDSLLGKAVNSLPSYVNALIRTVVLMGTLPLQWMMDVQASESLRETSDLHSVPPTLRLITARDPDTCISSLNSCSSLFTGLLASRSAPFLFYPEPGVTS